MSISVKTQENDSSIESIPLGKIFVIRIREFAAIGNTVVRALFSTRTFKLMFSLLAIDEETLPEVPRQTLEAAYPVFLDNPDRRERLGLQGDGPWRVVLAGYLLHALDRTGDEIRAEPYVAKSGDEFFVGPTR